MQPSPSQPQWRVLHLEDDAIDHDLVRRALERVLPALQITRVERLDELLGALQAHGAEVILADYRLAGFTALDAWQAVQPLHPFVPFILVSGAIGERAAVEAIQSGMADFVSKDELSKLPHVMARAIETLHTRQAKAQSDHQLAQSQQQLVTFAAHLQDSIEDERAAIAREIHDDVGGALAALRFDLAWLQRHAAEPAQLRHIESATASLQHALGASQRIMKNLRPAILDQGLTAALRWLADGFAQRTGVVVQFKAEPLSQPLPRAIELTAFRTAQEALTNVGKYAQCAHVSLHLSDAAGLLTLEVSDDGVGLTAAQRAQPNSFGLRGLAERARTVGGWLDIGSRPGQGTTLTLSVPLGESTLCTDPESAP